MVLTATSVDPLEVAPPSTTQPSTTTSVTPPTTTTSMGGVAPPAETQPGAIGSCKKWHVVGADDGCSVIANQYGISLDDFYKWNLGVGPRCESLW